MAEQIKFKFELDSDGTFDNWKDIGEAENELGKQCWKDGLKAQAIEYFKHEATCEIAIKAIKKTNSNEANQDHSKWSLQMQILQLSHCVHPKRNKIL